tara:strand:+ start:362 stop:871 length:510 start_codon:yes stop_codon:yes gene_type:complete
MKSVRIKSGDGAFVFSFNGRTYIIPPRGLGGTWKPYSEWKTDPVSGKRYLLAGLARKVSDLPKRDWIDIPPDAKKLLERGDLQKQLRTRGLVLEFIEDIQAAAEAERNELKTARETLSIEIETKDAEIAALRAKLERAKERLSVEPSPARRKAVQGNSKKKKEAPAAGA